MTPHPRPFLLATTLLASSCASAPAANPPVVHEAPARAEEAQSEAGEPVPGRDGLRGRGARVDGMPDGRWVFEDEAGVWAEGSYERGQFEGQWRYRCGIGEGLTCVVLFERGVASAWRVEVGDWRDGVGRVGGEFERELFDGDVRLVHHGVVPGVTLETWVPGDTADAVARWSPSPPPYGHNPRRHFDEAGAPGPASYFVVPAQCHGPYTTYHASGRRHEEGTCDGGRRQGVVRQYDERTGALVREEHFESGVRQGLSRAWYPSGALHFERTLARNTTPVGRWERRYENGHLHSTGEFTPEGVADGPWRFGHVNGRLAAEGTFDGGRPVGRWRYWTVDGRSVEPDDALVLRLEVRDVQLSRAASTRSPQPSEAAVDALRLRLVEDVRRLERSGVPACYAALLAGPQTWTSGRLAVRFSPRALPVGGPGDEPVPLPPRPPTSRKPDVVVETTVVEDLVGAGPACLTGHLRRLERHRELEFTVHVTAQPAMPALEAGPPERQPGRDRPCRELHDVTACEGAAHCRWQPWDALRDAFSAILTGHCTEAL